MKRASKTAPKASPLYARIRQILDLYAKLLVVAKGHALRDDFNEARKAVGAMIRKSKSSLSEEGEPIRHASRGKSLYPGYGLPCAMHERARYGG